MTPDQYRSALKALGLSQSAAAAFMGVNAVSSRRWATGKAPVPDSVAKLLWLMIALGMSTASVDEQIAAYHALLPLGETL